MQFFKNSFDLFGVFLEVDGVDLDVFKAATQKTSKNSRKVALRKRPKVPGALVRPNVITRNLNNP